MKTKLTAEFQRGFVRACVLILGTSQKWSKTERGLCNKATRLLFGRKRNRILGLLAASLGSVLCAQAAPPPPLPPAGTPVHIGTPDGLIHMDSAAVLRISAILTNTQCMNCVTNNLRGNKLSLLDARVRHGVFIYNVPVTGTNTPKGDIERYHLRCGCGVRFWKWEDPELAARRQPITQVKILGAVPPVPALWLRGETPEDPR